MHFCRQFDDFHPKKFYKLVEDQSLQPVKDHLYDKFGYVVKILPCFFSSNLVIKNQRKNYAGMHILELVMSKFS